MRVFYINLDGAQERRCFMERQAERLGLVFERFPAVLAAAIGDAEAARIGRAWERPLTKPEIGCFLSHHAVWTKIAAGDHPVLVLEDDAVLSPRLTGLLVAVPSIRGADFVNLESFDRRRFVSGPARPLVDGLGIVPVSRDKSGSAAYVLWPQGARKLLARAEKGAAPVDAFLHGLKSLRSFQVEPALAMQAHLLEKRGLSVAIPTTTFIQAPRYRLAFTRQNLPFHLRRLATQVSLAGEHFKRLGRNRYRMVDIVEAEFVMPAEGDDQSLS